MFKKMLCIVAWLPFVLSCGQQAEVVKTVPAAAPSPLEDVERLMKENEEIGLSPNADIRAYPEEIGAILERGYIVFGMTSADQKPFFYEDEATGQLIGLDVEIAYEIANRMGVRAVFNRDAASFDGVVLKVANKEVDIALSKLSRTIKRAEMVRFTHPYITFRQALLFNRLELAKVSTEKRLPLFIKNFIGNIAIIKNSSYIGYANVNFPNSTIKAYDTWGECVDALLAGNALAAYRDECEILVVTETRENAAILLKPVFISDRQDPISMAVAYDAPLLEAWLNTFLDEYIRQNKEDLEVWRIVKKHFGGLSGA